MANPWRGPAPARAGDGTGPLSTQRAGILEILQTRDGAVTAAQVAEHLRLHVNTAREHLDALVERDLAVRRRAPAVGRGRPAWTYVAAQLTEHDPRVREYAGLATALAGHLARTSTDPRACADAAGRVWGTELIQGTTSATTSPTTCVPTPAEAVAPARRQVYELLQRLGFDPVADPEIRSVALRRCPLLDAARRHPEVICAVHLGLVRGALESLGTSTEGTDLHPFAEPDACRLTLGVE